MNTFYHGDCLFVMNHDIEPESIDLIYLDPPFFTGKVQKGIAKWKPGEMPITYEDGKRFWKEKGIASNAPEWLNHIAIDRPDFAAYLFYMKERLEACRKVLKPTGSIYLHCDWRASHYLKMIMDEIFGDNNFRNEIVWCYKSGSYPKIGFAKKHDIIFRYSKSNDFLFKASTVKKEYGQTTISRYNKTDENGRKFAHVCSKGKWRDYYLDEAEQVIEDYWIDIPMLKGNYAETVGYPTQKPLALLERIIKASSNEGDIVLDPFCGCGTAIIAAQRLNRQWIGIDINKIAYEVSGNRLGELPLDFTHFEYVSRDLEEVLTITKPQGKDSFEEWVNRYFKATKPSPDGGVDGITKDGIPIQTKTNIIKEPILHQFIHQASSHSKVPKPVKHVIAVSQIGFDDNARRFQFTVEANEHIKVELLIPNDLLRPITE